VELLSLEERGEFLTAIYYFFQTGDIPHIENRAVKMAFAFVKDQLQHDKDKYDEICVSNWVKSLSGGGRPRKDERTVGYGEDMIDAE
jgi:hypothetical protein